MTITKDELLARWATDEGKPYKGSLIDADAHRKNPNDIGCMCAQGQALHLLAGWTPAELANTEQAKADKATADLFGISRAHAVLLRSINDKADGAPAIVLTHPEAVLGEQAQTVLAFWRHMDRMTASQWAAVRDTAGAAARDAARVAARNAAGASNEIQGAAILRKKSSPFYFLQLFGFADPEAVLAGDTK